MSNSDIEFDAKVQGVLKEFAALLLEKHKDYGPRPLLKGGWTAIIAKFEMKVERLQNLIYPTDWSEQGPERVAKLHDAVKDTLMDIMGYGCLGIIYQEELK